jgi:hypothetical protein
MEQSEAETSQQATGASFLHGSPREKVGQRQIDTGENTEGKGKFVQCDKGNHLKQHEAQQTKHAQLFHGSIREKVFYGIEERKKRVRACLKNSSSRREPALTASPFTVFPMQFEPTHVGCHGESGIFRHALRI